jgi:hypothetical protein
VTIGIICSGNHLESWQAQWLIKFRESNGAELILMPVTVIKPIHPLINKYIPPVNTGSLLFLKQDNTIIPDLYINFTSERWPQSASIKKDILIIHFDFLLNSYASILAPLEEANPVSRIQLISNSDQNNIDVHSEGIFRTLRHSIRLQLQSMTEQAGYLLSEYILRKKKLPVKKMQLKSEININPIALKSKVLASLLYHRFDQLFYFHRWNIGIAKILPEELLTAPSSIKINWMKEEKGRSFNADPFITSSTEGVQVFFEHFSEKTGSGRICTVPYNKNGFSSYTTIIEKNTHLSYPFIIEKQNKKYLLPENAAANELSIHELDANNQVIGKKIIIPDIDIVDPTMLFRDGKWWMFGTRKKDKSADLRLYIYFADEIDGTWKEHAMNPVKCDISNSRPAGNLFIHNNKLYRPSQDSSKTYGGRIVINEVKELTADSYSEVAVAVLEPHQLQGNYNGGIHTVSFSNGYMAVDGKKKIISLKRFS